MAAVLYWFDLHYNIVLATTDKVLSFLHDVKNKAMSRTKEQEEIVLMGAFALILFITLINTLRLKSLHEQ